MNGVRRRAALHLGARVIALAAMILPFASLAHAAAINVSWTAPTTNANGTQLTDLAGYRIYLGTSTPACPGGGYHAVTSTTATPAAGQTVSSRIASLTASATYFVRITAVDKTGVESSCSSVASGVAHADISVSPTTTVGFGSIAPGATVDRTFTVKNTSAASLSGTTSVGAPFSIVSGGSFTLSPSASQNVVVRFRPTASGTFSSNVNFTTNGDTTTRAVTGTATGTTSTPTTSSGTLDVFLTSPASGATVSGNGTAVVWVENTKGTGNTFTLSVDGRVESSQTTTSRGPISLPWTSIGGGTHTVTATVRDSTGQTGTASITVKVPTTTTTTTTTTTSPTPTTSTSLSLSMTEPDPGETVSGVVWVVLWANGAQGTNSFWISVNGEAVGSVTTTADGPVAIPWTTSSVSNGAHTLLAVIRDGTGRTASASVSVTTRN
jgi:hypothetical protein